MANATSNEVIQILQPRIDKGWLEVITQRGIMMDSTGSPQQRAALMAQLCRLPVKGVFGGQFIVLVPKDELNDAEAVGLRSEIQRIAASIH